MDDLNPTGMSSTLPTVSSLLDYTEKTESPTQRLAVYKSLFSKLGYSLRDPKYTQKAQTQGTEF